MNAPEVPGKLPVDRFNEVIALIKGARQQAIQTVNTQLIERYWQVGAYIRRKLENAEWGDSVVGQLAEHLAMTQPGLRGFTRSNLFRMRQFQEIYRGEEKVAPLARQLSWSHNVEVARPACRTSSCCRQNCMSSMFRMRSGLMRSKEYLRLAGLR